MPSSYTFSGAGLYVLDASPSGTSRVRLRFSRPPNRSNPANTNDALREANYTLSGSIAVTVTSVVAVSDAQSVELVTSSPLPYGSWTVTVSNVQAPGAISLTSPTSATFNVAQQETSLTAGTEDEGDAFNVIRKHLNAALDGSNWRALIAALADADNYVWNLARNAFEQLFLSSASGKYLDRLANNDGNVRPSGMSDDAFRPLAVELSTGRVTYLSIMQILESFYGKEALRAYADTSDAPFSMVDGDTITFTFEGREFTYTVNEDDYRSVGDATASELAVALARFFEQNDLEAIAAVLVNPTTGDEFVRIYSETLGLRSSVEVTSTASLGFPVGKRTVYNGSRTVSVSQTTDGVLEVSVPVTADTERNSGNAGYVYGNEPIAIRDVRKTDTTVTVDTESAHSLSEGDWVEIVGFQPTPAIEWTKSTEIGASHQTTLKTTSNNTVAEAIGGARVKISGGILVGGGDTSGGATTDSFLVTHTTSTTASSGLADGSPSFTLTATPTGAFATTYAGGASSALSGVYDNEALFTGGFWASYGQPSAKMSRYSGGNWSTLTQVMAYSRAWHSQVTLDGGRVLIAGGLGGAGDTSAGAVVGDTSINAVELFDPYYNSIATVAPMLSPRSEMGVVKLNDGRVLVTGGFAQGQPTSNDLPGIVGHWRFEVNGGSSTPSVDGAYPITTLLPPAAGKVNRALNFAPSGGTAYTDNATLRNTVNMTSTGEMSIDFWLYMDSDGSGHTPISLLYLQDPGDATEAAFELWYHADGTDLTFSYRYGGVQSTPIVCSNPDMYFTWSHICVVGTTDAGNASYKIYVNGALAGETVTPDPEPGAGTGSERLALGYDPVGTNPTDFLGKFDDMRIWNRALSHGEVLRQYLTGAGTTRPEPVFRGRYLSQTSPRMPLASAEIYDPDTDTWTATPNMNSFRGGHNTVLLPSGEVMVIGGDGFNHFVGTPTGDPDWPLYRLNTTEIYDPASNQWRSGPRLPRPMAYGWAVLVGQYIYCGDFPYGFDWNGSDFVAATDNPIYWLDTRKMDRWNTLPVDSYRTSTSTRNTWAVANDEFILLGGTNFNGAVTRGFDVIGPVGRHTTSTNGINGLRRVASIVSPTSFTFESDVSGRANLHGDRKAKWGFGTTKFQYTNATYAVSKAGGTATVTATVPEDTYAVWVGSTDANFASGWKILTGRTATTFQYAEAGTASGALDWIGTTNDIAAMPEMEAVAASGDFGAFVLDTSRFTLFGTDTATATSMPKGVAVEILDVASTADIEDRAGYVILGMGTRYETAPIRYLEKISATKLLLASPFTPTVELPAGLAVSSVALEPTTDLTDSLWITGSILAMLAAKSNVEESVANDVELQFNVIYPGDRGLGGEGSTHSDKFVVWRPDTVEDPE